MKKRIERAIAKALEVNSDPRAIAAAVLEEMGRGASQSMVDAAYEERDRLGMLETQGIPAAEFKAMIAQAVAE